MRVIVDAFGGDNAPLAPIEGAVAAHKEFGAEVVLCGDEKKIRDCASEHQISLDGIGILQADDVFDMHDDPNQIIKSKRNTSLAVALKAAADSEMDAVVSAGSTGAVLFGGTFIVKRIKGIKRPALGTVLPTTGKPYLLMDCGANLNCRPDVLMQFGELGSVYMEKVLGVKNPSVGLLNNGTEETKGGEVLVEAYQLLKNDDRVNFIGNVEARDVPGGACDVVVADGFAGNIVLKLTEGLASSFIGMFKKILLKNALTKLAALMIKPGLKEFKKSMDYSEYGGAPLLGLTRPVIKAHGSSNAKAFKNAIRQAVKYSETGMIDEINNRLKAVDKVV